ncbi:hypothetical protein G6F45_011487 [Rhizopus arrhizus]|uniref:RNA-directed DNA polymerase n=1 Tax=Rhizopus delemar TaxID=936053 RepID=A0A9P7CJE1_9FUNG|nr:hypothetical protein G6F52_009849 [Rhizopus delemar]KAG1563953.1 hypothetical protein G6F50_011498 [Rhizopus delemar]KAG1620631.1 hypothetical protein G6F45_011487 [Rhizopus arrhizus]KAG1628540.1 hypothetical protein G6F44_011882 [Rhizopus delemar]
MGSIAFDNQKNGQSNTHQYTKPINKPTSQHHLNALITEGEYDPYNHELCAAVRPDRPPEVISSRVAPYSKGKASSKRKEPEKPTVTKRVTTRRHMEEINQPPIQKITTDQNMDMDTELPIEIKDNQPTKKKIIKRRKPEILYDIAADVLDKPANITVRDLITTVPSLRRQLTTACRPNQQKRTISPDKTTIAVIEDNEDYSTTAVYSKVSIGSKRIRALVDCGAAKTCMSKALADALNLEIDASSESVFTLGNGTKQPALGIIYDVPIQVKENMIIPCTVEVLPSCPSHFIIGNNWLNRSKARIDFNTSSLKVTYKNKNAELEISFLRKNEKLPQVSSYKQTYKNPVSTTNSHLVKQVHFEDETIENSSEESSENETEEESSSLNESEDEENDEKSLLVLENDGQEEMVINHLKDICYITAGRNGLYISANSSKKLVIDKAKTQNKNIKYIFEITNAKLKYVYGCFDSSSNLIMNRKTIEIHLYNRTREHILLCPFEEIGILEEIDLQEETNVKAYDVLSNPELFVMDLEESPSINKKEKEPLESELYTKLEVGNLDKAVEKKLRILLKKYYSIFDWNNDTIGNTSIITHKIIIEQDTQPISHRPYRLSPIEAKYLEQEIDKYCKLGVISPSNSPWAAPVILVKKKNGEYRMVIDYRKLNAVTKKDSYPLPRIDDLLDTLGKASIFSALDMRAGFHQVPLEEESKELTAFTTKYGVYHYNTLPMGLVNSPATFQRLIDLCFRPLINKCLVAYIDDLNIYSRNNDDHLQHLEQVFNCIKIANLKLNPEKCFFFKNHLKFLGYIITKEGIQTDPSKIQKIIDYPIPQTVTQIRGFLGLASYYRRFIKNFAAIARPLHDQTKTLKKIPWTDKTTQSFLTLKGLLTTAPVLSRPDFSKPFILVTDASKLGLGCILTQLDADGKEHPVIYASRSLKSSEVNYAATKLECLAVVWAVKMFRPYLLGEKFTIMTDHSALTGLLKAKNPTGILARWIAILSEYEYEIKYRPGRVNESADFLSRLGY